MVWYDSLFRHSILVTEQDTEEFKYVNPGYGVGFRFKFNKKARTSLAFDFGWGKDDSSNLYEIGGCLLITLG